ncbi:glycosyltransferase [Paraburkholderia aspalathi]|uniref:glycosyltransferase n=1 Tax=Paraburkholderia aspalathi TaxID=1324617 RepID=UPI0038B6DFBB
MEYTGERFVPEQQGNIELEHLHRYLCAAELSAQKDVLDIASGEGYGSSILARVARSVTGVDISEEAVRHAQQKYQGQNLEYRAGSAAQIPLADASVDMVVSFETIEHHDQHEAMMSEIRRVLRPGGLLVMSSPDKRVYSDVPGFSNPYHVQELTRGEFESLMKASFANVSMYGQRIVYGSALLAEEGGQVVSFAKKQGEVKRGVGLVEPMYLIALASDSELPRLNSGVFETRIDEADIVVELNRVIKARDDEIFEFRENRTSLEAKFVQVRRAEEEARELVLKREETLRGVEATLRDQCEQLRKSQELLEASRFREIASQSELINLKSEKKDLQASVRYLGDSVAQLNATVRAYRNSFSWRVTAPLRLVTRSMRKIKRVVLIPYQMYRSFSRPGFKPERDLQVVDGGYVSTGDDPQFAILPDWRGINPGWALLTVDVATGEEAPRPILYAFAGDDGAQVFAYPISGYVKGREKRLIVLPAGVRSLRFDPTDKKGVRLHVNHLSVRNLGKLALIREGYAALDDAKRKSMLNALLHGDIRTAKEIVRNGVVGKYDKGEYNAWVELYDTLSEQDIARLRVLGESLPAKPLISIVMPVYNPRPKYLRKALDSVLAQTYSHWELCIADDASTNPEVRQVLEEYANKDSRVKVVFREMNGHISAASNSALELVSGEFTALMDHDDALPAHALYLVAEEINSHPDVDLIYTDEDKVDENDRRHDPYFKTDWNRELFYSQNFVAHMGVYRTSIVRKIEGFRVGFEGSQDYDFVLRFLLHTNADRIRHVPHVLYHWRIFPGVTSFSTDNPDASVETARRALIEYFEKVEPTAEVVPIRQFPGWWRIKRQPPAILPRVSLIVPTRDRLEVLETAINGLLRETDYPNLEVIIVDNDSADPSTLAFFDTVKKDSRVQVLRVSGAFNFSALNNRAAEVATGTVLGFINNDIEVIHADWLMELVTQVSQSNVGAAGAKLYYANDTIQHAGVVMGLYGVAAHGHRHFPRNTIGYFGRPMLVQNTSAVTAACMIVPKAVFEEVGGYDEINLTVGYNDVDLCLKIRAAGYDVVFTPFAELYHLESVSRGENLTAAQIERDARERAYMLSRWRNEIAHDPFYSPNLTSKAEDYSLAFPPRTPKSWKNTQG